MERREARKIQLTDQDLELLEFLAEHRLALPDHAAALLGRAVDTARMRLTRLVKMGYVREERVFHGHPPMHLITRTGLRAVGRTLKPPKLDVREYQHDVGVAWLWIAARRGTFGPVREVIAERRMRSQDGARDGDGSSAPLLGVRLGGVGPRGRERVHYPDLLLTTAGGRRIALELELSPKGRTRLEAILAGYAADPRIGGVVYLVEDAAVARTVRDAARRVGVSSLVHVQRVRSTVSMPGAAGGVGVTRAAPGRATADARRARGRGAAPEVAL